MPYLRMKRSTRPSVSRIFCVPVKKGWFPLHTSTWISGWVEPVVITTSPLQMTLASGYQVGWMSGFGIGKKSALGELRSLTGFLEAVLAAFLGTGVAAQVTFCLQRLAVVGRQFT